MWLQIIGLLLQLVGIAYYAHVQRGQTWHDAKWLTPRWRIAFAILIVGTLLQIVSAAVSA